MPASVGRAPGVFAPLRTPPNAVYNRRALVLPLDLPPRGLLLTRCCQEVNPKLWPAKLPLTFPHLWIVLWTTFTRARDLTLILAFLDRKSLVLGDFSRFRGPGHNNGRSCCSGRLDARVLDNPRAAGSAHLPILVRRHQGRGPLGVLPRAAGPEQIRQGLDRTQISAADPHRRGRGRRP